LLKNVENKFMEQEHAKGDISDPKDQVLAAVPPSRPAPAEQSEASVSAWLVLSKVVPWLAVIASSLSATFAIRSFLLADENLRIQRETAKPLVTIVQQLFTVQGGAAPEHGYQISYRNMGNQQLNLCK
jgi:hypothetical protein